MRQTKQINAFIHRTQTRQLSWYCILSTKSLHEVKSSLQIVHCTYAVNFSVFGTLACMLYVQVQVYRLKTNNRTTCHILQYNLKCANALKFPTTAGSLRTEEPHPLLQEKRGRAQRPCIGQG